MKIAGIIFIILFVFCFNYLRPKSRVKISLKDEVKIYVIYAIVILVLFIILLISMYNFFVYNGGTNYG